MNADGHAVILLLTIPVNAIVIWRFHGKDFSLRPAVIRFITFAFVVGLAMLFALPTYQAGPGNNPSSQLVLPLLEASAIWALVDRGWIRAAGATVAIAVGIGLGSHFHHLVLAQSECHYTGDPKYISNSCNRPAEAHELWHTWITGIYGIHVQ
jgi:hypothetical protein